MFASLKKQPFIKMAQLSTLIAEGREKTQGRRAGFYEVDVATEDGTPVALVHCVAHRVGR